MSETNKSFSFEALKSARELALLETMRDASLAETKQNDMHRLIECIEIVGDEYKSILAIYLNTINMLYQDVKDIPELEFTIVVTEDDIDFEEMKQLLLSCIQDEFTKFPNLKFIINRERCIDGSTFGSGLLLYSRMTSIYQSSYLSSELYSILSSLQQEFGCAIDIQEDMFRCQHDLVFITALKFQDLLPIMKRIDTLTSLYNLRVNKGIPDRVEPSTYFMVTSFLYDLSYNFKTVQFYG